jgi:hypothetical protein
MDTFALNFVGDPAVIESPLIQGLRSRLQQLHSDVAILRVERVVDLPSGRKFQVFLSLLD